MTLKVTRVNPDGLPVNPAFAQGVLVEQPQRLLFVGGQNAVTADGGIDGDDLATQTVRALRNVELVLLAAGGTLADVVSWTILAVEGHPLQEGFQAFRTVWSPAEPPAISVAVVAGLANPRFLVEISAVAALGPAA